MIRIQTQDFDTGAEIKKLSAANPKIGAIASFIGLARDVNDNARVIEIALEHYPGMTEKALMKIVEEAKSRWDIIDALIIHRVGKLKPTDQIVLVAVAAAHRHAAFDACGFIIDHLKTQAPFWKKEKLDNGERWVEARASDEAALLRWDKK
jgi:molybdopterin synthase catalytic subunit